MQSARDKPEIVREYLAKECSESRVKGPLDQVQFPFVHTSRFGIIPKGSTGKWWLIVDMSAPEGASINDGISESVCSLSYPTVDDAVHSITSRGQGALLALGKIDIKNAFRNVPVHPEDRWLMGMHWDSALYIDSTLPFGLRSAYSRLSQTRSQDVDGCLRSLTVSHCYREAGRPCLVRSLVSYSIRKPWKFASHSQDCSSFNR